MTRPRWVRLLGEFVVRVANLVEAEGQAARRVAGDFLAVACAYHAASLLAVASLVALAAAVYRGLTDGLDVQPGWAYLVTSLFLGLLAGGCVWGGVYLKGNKGVRR